ncbi:MAG: UDP-glucose 4-epimerase GalE [Candidatus Aceula meridiana]|nr:UDP-glucose 4-epimerase GalE [Candidatus Aceula meridiana]
MGRKKIVVTGGAGYIGSHVAIALWQAGYEPIIIDNFSNSEHRIIDGIKSITGQDVVLHEGDCADQDFLIKVFEKEGVVVGAMHFAAFKAVGESFDKPLEYYHNNIGSLIFLIKAMQESQCRNLVFSSSATVYGEPDELPVTELSPQKLALSPYGNTKQICEKIIEDAAKSGMPLKSIALRYFNPIGAHPSALIGELPLGMPNNLVPVITQTAAGIREKLTVFGNDYDTPDKTCVRDYIDIMDLAEAHVDTLVYLERIKEDNCFDAINVGTGQGHSVAEVLEAFQRINNVKVNFVIGKRRFGDIAKLYANVKKAELVLGWKAKYTIEESLKNAWKWQLAL